MNNIQKQIEQFLSDVNSYIIPHSDSDIPAAFAEKARFKANYYALLRSVVEECCKRECNLCRGENHGYHDNPEKHNEIEVFVHWSNTDMPGWLVCQANGICCHFAWLLEGE